MPESGALVPFTPPLEQIFLAVRPVERLKSRQGTWDTSRFSQRTLNVRTGARTVRLALRRPVCYTARALPREAGELLSQGLRGTRGRAFSELPPICDIQSAAGHPRSTSANGVRNAICPGEPLRAQGAGRACPKGQSRSLQKSTDKIKNRHNCGAGWHCKV